MTDDVQAELDALRANIYGGRGPGIGDEELERRTTLRPCIGNRPTAATRQELRVRTMRARGEEQAAALEEDWAQDQRLGGGTG